MMSTIFKLKLFYFGYYFFFAVKDEKKNQHEVYWSFSENVFEFTLPK